MERDQPAPDFFGQDGEVIASLPPSTRVAYARDNARLFIGTVINNPSTSVNRDAISIDGLPMIDVVTISLLSFTEVIHAAVSEAANVLDACQEYAAKLMLADLSIAALHMDCSLIGARLEQIEGLILGDGEEKIKDRAEYEYRKWLRDCNISFFVLNKHLGTFDFADPGDLDKSTFKQKLQCVWAFPHMEKICQTISRLASSTGVFFSAFQSDNTRTALKIMENQETMRTLAEVSSDAASLHESFFTAPEGGVSSTRGSVMGTEIFGFDEILHDTDLYRKALFEQAVRFPSKGHHRIAEVAAVEQVEDDALSASDGSTITELEETSKAPGRVSEQRSAVVLPRLPYGTPTKERVIIVRNQPRPRRRWGIFSSDAVETNQRYTPADPESNNGNIMTESPLMIVAPGQNIPSVSFEQLSTRASFDFQVGVPDTATSSDQGLHKGKPSLRQVLWHQSAKPYTLTDLYVYMRDIEHSVDYLDFWLDISKHMLLCRDYVRDMNDTGFQDYDEIDEYGAPGYVTIRKEAVTRSDIKVSALKILYTYVLPGAEREIKLPTELSNTLTDEVEMNERCDPEAFDARRIGFSKPRSGTPFQGFSIWADRCSRSLGSRRVWDPW